MSRNKELAEFLLVALVGGPLIMLSSLALFGLIPIVGSGLGFLVGIFLWWLLTSKTDRYKAWWGRCGDDKRDFARGMLVGGSIMIAFSLWLGGWGFLIGCGLWFLCVRNTATYQNWLYDRRVQYRNWRDDRRAQNKAISKSKGVLMILAAMVLVGLIGVATLPSEYRHRTHYYASCVADCDDRLATGDYNHEMWESCAEVCEGVYTYVGSNKIKGVFWAILGVGIAGLIGVPTYKPVYRGIKKRTARAALRAAQRTRRPPSRPLAIDQIGKFATWVGVIGAGFLFIGTFLPIVNSPVFGGAAISIVEQDVGWIFSVLALLCLALSALGMYRTLTFVGAGTAALVVADFVYILENLSDPDFGGLGSLGWGWVFVFVGLVAVLLAGISGWRRESNFRRR